MNNKFFLGVCGFLIIVIAEPSKSEDEIHDVAPLPPQPPLPEIDNHIHVLPMLDVNVKNHSHFSVANNETKDNETKSNEDNEIKSNEDNEIKSNEDIWYNKYNLTTQRPYYDTDEIKDSHENIKNSRENNSSVEMNSNESISDKSEDNHWGTTEPYYYDETGYWKQTTIRTTERPYIDSDENTENTKENSSIEKDSNEYIPDEYRYNRWRTIKPSYYDETGYWTTRRPYINSDSSSSEEITTTKKPEPEPEPKSKKDCRRIKFQTKKPEIDILIAINTDLEDCAEEVDDKHANLVLSESESKDLESKRSKEAEIIVYVHFNYQGDSENVHLKQGHCHKFEHRFDNQISSINTKGFCIKIYENKDCDGRSAQLGPEVTHANSFLGRIKMNDVISSMKLC